MKSNKFEHNIVSRSPSIASLPLGPEKNTLTQSQQSIASSNSVIFLFCILCGRK